MKEPHAHPNGNFNFETNSLFEQVGKLDSVIDAGKFKYGIVSCVSNPDPKYPLYVRWLIPGPAGWVQPNGKLESAPRLTNETKQEQSKGCLQFGNRGDTTHAHFFSLSDDKSRLGDEQKRGCREAAAAAQSQAGTAIENILLKIKNFFPSDSKRPQETMLRLDGRAGIEKKGDGRYSSILTYEITPVGKEGSVKGIFIFPRFVGRSESLLASFNKDNPGGIRASDKGVVEFAVSNVNEPQLTYASYEIYDQNKVPVASIAIPILLSGK
jgi:hypothetical protein